MAPQYGAGDPRRGPGVRLRKLLDLCICICGRRLARFVGWDLVVGSRRRPLLLDEVLRRGGLWLRWLRWLRRVRG